MATPRATFLPTDRLRASPNYALHLAMDGRAYVAKESEPYTQYWLNDRYRLLLNLFSRRGGETVDRAGAAYLRLTGHADTPAERKRIAAAIADMADSGVLLASGQDVSRYDAGMADYYLEHRPFPPELVRQIAAAGDIGRETRVLDLAGGPGDLALQLAAVSGAVTLMELSAGFIASARKRAAARGLPLMTVHESANRLVHDATPQDVVIVSQALHWLDDVAICRALCRLLPPNGSFFVVQSAFDTPATHPLHYIFGPNSVLGPAPDRRFDEGVAALDRRLTRLFEALDAPDVERIDPLQHYADAGTPLPARIRPAGARIYRQARPIGLGFASGFLSDAHIAVTGQSSADFRAEMTRRCAGATPGELAGTFHWALLHYRRTANPPAPGAIDFDTVHPLPYHGPPGG